MKTYSPEEKFILEYLEKKLPEDLTYHGLHHTIDVLNAAMKIGETENLSAHEIKLLRIAVLFHDAGFTEKYKDHEQHGCDMAKKDLSRFGYTDKEIEIICGMIMATKIPQNPKNLLEKIICDADLDYLGRNDFNRISNTLFEEMKIYGHIHDIKEWNKIQENFLKKHQYYTEFGKKNREHLKCEHLQKISKLVSSYH